jgi:hypothetical protein
LRKRVADLALYDRPLDGIVSIGGCEIADQCRRRAPDFDDTPFEQLDTRGALGQARILVQRGRESECCYIPVSWPILATRWMPEAVMMNCPTEMNVACIRMSFSSAKVPGAGPSTGVRGVGFALKGGGCLSHPLCG